MLVSVDHLTPAASTTFKICLADSPDSSGSYLRFWIIDMLSQHVRINACKKILCANLYTRISASDYNEESWDED
jgi:hypothetical protein